MFSAHVDLARAVLIVALVDACLLLPILRYPERQRRLSIPAAIRKRPTRQRLDFLARRAAVLGFFFAPAIMIVFVPGLVLLDLKLSLSTVGFFTGTVSTVISIVMTLVSGALLMRVAAPRLTATLALGVVFSAILFAIATAISSKWLGYVAALLNVTIEGGLGVPFFNAIYQWSEGSTPRPIIRSCSASPFLVSFPAASLRLVWRLTSVGRAIFSYSSQSMRPRAPFSRPSWHDLFRRMSKDRRRDAPNGQSQISPIRSALGGGRANSIAIIQRRT